MTIYNKQGEAILKAVIHDNSARKRVIMSDNHVLINFNLAEYVEFKKGSYILFEDNKYWIMDSVHPTYDESAGAFKYSIKFEDVDGYLRLYNIFYRKQNLQEIAFALTSDIASFGSIIVDCINHELGGTNWSVSCDAITGVKPLSFKGEKLFDVATMVSEAFECDWWTERNGLKTILHFGKSEIGSEELLVSGQMIQNIDRKQGDETDWSTVKQSKAV